jgi:hypothetical protein
MKTILFGAFILGSFSSSAAEIYNLKTGAKVSLSNEYVDSPSELCFRGDVTKILSDIVGSDLLTDERYILDSFVLDNQTILINVVETKCLDEGASEEECLLVPEVSRVHRCEYIKD